jgi:hypothetical protein
VRVPEKTAEGLTFCEANGIVWAIRPLIEAIPVELLAMEFPPCVSKFAFCTDLDHEQPEESRQYETILIGFEAQFMRIPIACTDPCIAQFRMVSGDWNVCRMR